MWKVIYTREIQETDCALGSCVKNEKLMTKWFLARKTLYNDILIKEREYVGCSAIYERSWIENMPINKTTDLVTQ